MFLNFVHSFSKSLCDDILYQDSDTVIIKIVIGITIKVIIHTERII